MDAIVNHKPKKFTNAKVFFFHVLCSRVSAKELWQNDIMLASPEPWLP